MYLEILHVVGPNCYHILILFSRYPITNLMASAKYASVYSTTGDNGSVLLLPHGCPELHKYTSPTEMEYSITGLSKNQIDPVSIPISNVYKDPTTNVR